MDVSEKGFGPCSFKQLLNHEGEIHCSLLVGESRVFPKKYLSIPRLKLTVVLSSKMVCLIRKELNLRNAAEKFWIDSQVVLAYIKSITKRL